jgi:Family of unknown function (DUF5723)
MKSKLFLLSFLPIYLICSDAWAQNEGTLYLMNSLPQVVYVNPAFVPKYKISVGLPGSSFMLLYSNSGFSYNDMTTKENGVIAADLDKLYGRLKSKNYITLASQFDVFRLSLKVNPRLYLTYNATAKTYSRLMLPKDMMGVFINGTSEFIGSTATLAPAVESLVFLEQALGGAFTVNKDLVVGARFKLLKGLANATTNRTELDLSVDEINYAITIEGNMDVKTAGINRATGDNFDFGNDYKDYLKNNGFAIDLGATYRLKDRMNVSLSVVDLGFIKWKNDTYGYTLDPSTARYTFEGIDLNKVLNDDSDYLNNLGDSIQNNFEPQEGVIPSYRTPVPTKIYAGFNYELRRNFTAGIVLYSEIFRRRFMAGATLGLNKNFGKRFTATGSYTISNNSYNNIGLGASLNLPPFQLYLVGDNILSAAVKGKDASKFVNSTQLFNLRAGLNIVLGWDKGPDRLAGNEPSPKFKSKMK